MPSTSNSLPLCLADKRPYRTEGTYYLSARKIPDKSIVPCQIFTEKTIRLTMLSLSTATPPLPAVITPNLTDQPAADIFDERWLEP